MDRHWSCCSFYDTEGLRAFFAERWQVGQSPSDSTASVTIIYSATALFSKKRTNFLVARLVTSCAAIEFAVSANLRDVFRESFMLVFFITAAFYFNWRLMLGAMVIAPIIAFLTSKFSRSLRKLAEESTEGNKLLNDTAQETLANQASLVLCSRGARKRQVFKGAAVIARANLLRDGSRRLPPHDRDHRVMRFRPVISAALNKPSGWSARFTSCFSSFALRPILRSRASITRYRGRLPP